MQVTHTVTYAAPPERVHAMLVDPAFREEVCTAQRALEHDVEVVTADDRTTVVVSRTQSLEGAPTVATRIAGDRVRIVQREDWHGTARADLSMEVPGRPGALHGVLELRGNGDGTTEQRVTGEVKVHIPLVGGKIERLVADILVRGLRREERVGHAWLAAGR